MQLCYNPVWLIAKHTVKEIRRQKIFYILVALAVFMMAGGMVLGPLSLNEQIRLSINFSLVACHMGSVLLSIYFASSLLVSELQTTAIILLTKPVSRSQFIIGRVLGLVAVLCTVWLLMICALLLLYWFYEQSVGIALFAAFWGIALESLILIGVACFFSLSLSPFLTLVHTFFIFLIGHLVNGFMFLISSQDLLLKTSIDLALRVFPNFEKFNWRTQALYQDFIAYSDIAWNTVYAAFWMLVLLLLTGMIFERKHIG